VFNLSHSHCRRRRRAHGECPYWAKLQWPMTPAPPPPPPSRHLDNDCPLLTSHATSSSHPPPPSSLRHHRPSNVSSPHHRPPNASSPRHLLAPPLIEGCGHSHTLPHHHQHHEPQQRWWGSVSMTARQRRVEKGEQECGEHDEANYFAPTLQTYINSTTTSVPRRWPKMMQGGISPHMPPFAPPPWPKITARRCVHHAPPRWTHFH